ncbi:hypothetical protein [Paracoccus salsus]|uniref:hypothetical protein n=1 Tax=Paracoccus salsus TaxID=2911061 RepID=UPI001F327A59|nr:hypothetical protein [Paracoccus salsus]MCF3973929.1 hypothetical protein [Paracoccus salsus]
MKAFAIIAALSVSACGGMGTVFSEYSGIKPVSFVANGSTWRVFDKPGSLMITPSIAAAAASGLKDGAALGTTQTIKGQDYQDAAAVWLAGKGPDCRITSGGQLIPAQWQFLHTC